MVPRRYVDKHVETVYSGDWEGRTVRLRLVLVLVEDGKIARIEKIEMCELRRGGGGEWVASDGLSWGSIRAAVAHYRSLHSGEIASRVASLLGEK
jgi:hypothetical protein